MVDLQTKPNPFHILHCTPKDDHTRITQVYELMTLWLQMEITEYTLSNEIVDNVKWAYRELQDPVKWGYYAEEFDNNVMLDHKTMLYKVNELSADIYFKEMRIERLETQLQQPTQSKPQEPKQKNPLQKRIPVRFVDLLIWMGGVIALSHGYWYGGAMLIGCGIMLLINRD